MGKNETIAPEDIDLDNEQPSTMKVDVLTLCILDGTTALYRVENFMNNNEAFKYVTGLGNYEHIKFVYGVLGLAVTQLKYKSTKLDPPDELF